MKRNKTTSENVDRVVRQRWRWSTQSWEQRDKTGDEGRQEDEKTPADPVNDAETIGIDATLMELLERKTNKHLLSSKFENF